MVKVVKGIFPEMMKEVFLLPKQYQFKIGTVDSLYLDYPLSRISLYLKQNVRSLEISPKNTA